MTMQLTSNAFKEGEQIPAKYTLDGQDISPELEWGEPPHNTQTFVLIVDDLDAPGDVITHWVIFNIPSNVRQLGEGVTAQEKLDNGAFQGKNDFGRIGYSGPSPPKGFNHRYRFTIYALDRTLYLKLVASRKQVLDAMRWHIIDQGRLSGIYRR